MLAKSWVLVLSAMALAVVGAFLLGMGIAEAHTTGAFHWHWTETGWSNATACLWSPSGQILYCY